MASNTRKQPTETRSVFKDVYLKQIEKIRGTEILLNKTFKDKSI